MQGVIYVDILVLINAIIGYFIIKCTAYFASRKQNILRLILASFFSGLSSLTILLTFLNSFVLLILKLILACFIILVAFEIINFRIFAKTLCYFIIANILLAGIVIFAIFCGASNINLTNFSIYVNISPVLLIISILIMYIIINVFLYIFGKANISQSIEYNFCIDNKQISGIALLDTGMHIKDAISSQSAILCSYLTLKQKLPINLSISLNNYFVLGELTLPFWLISVKTATGMKMLPAIRCEYINLNGKNNNIKKLKAVLVFTNESIIDGTYDIILHPNYLKEY